MFNPNGEYYLHENGSLIYKPHGGVERDSPFVIKVWSIVTLAKSPKNYLAFLIEALNAGADRKRVLELANHQTLDTFIPGTTEHLEKYVPGELTPTFE